MLKRARNERVPYAPHRKPRKVPANDVYGLEPMPVPAVLVTLKGTQGGLLLDEDTGKEVRKGRSCHPVHARVSGGWRKEWRGLA